MGSKYNIMIEWKTWKITTEPLKPIGADEPETCTIYGKDSNILKQDGWRRFKKLRIEKREYYAWPIKLNSDRSTLHPHTNIDTKFHKTTTVPRG